MHQHDTGERITIRQRPNGGGTPCPHHTLYRAGLPSLLLRDSNHRGERFSFQRSHFLQRESPGKLTPDEPIALVLARMHDAQRGCFLRLAR